MRTTSTFSVVIRTLRRYPLLAALLVAVSPALGGQLLSWYHPCPFEAAMPIGAHGTATAGALSHPAPSSQAPSHRGHCTCIGCCCPPALATPPEAVVAIAAVGVPVSVDWLVIEATDLRSRALELLPEKTAPPLA